jgi:hypothetical protein
LVRRPQMRTEVREMKDLCLDTRLILIREILEVMKGVLESTREIEKLKPVQPTGAHLR